MLRTIKPTIRNDIGENTASSAIEATADFHKKEFTDWFLVEGDPTASLSYPGAKKVEGHLIPYVTKLHDASVKACYQKDDSGKVIEIVPDYRIKVDGFYFRGHRQKTVDGILHILRATPNKVPEVGNLGIPNEVVDILCSQMLGELGGLVIVCGQPGHGKSTTCASVILKRVKRFGSFCLTVEDPPEYPLSGEYLTHGGVSGKIIQVQAHEKSFAHDLRDALRCYPSNELGSILFVGEVRDPESAAQVLRASAIGQLVFMTTHAGDPIVAIEKLLSQAGEGLKSPKEASSLLSGNLRAVIHQRLNDGKLIISPLFSMSGNSVVAATIRGGDIRQLATEIQSQKVKLSINQLRDHLFGTGTLKRNS